MKWDVTRALTPEVFLLVLLVRRTGLRTGLAGGVSSVRSMKESSSSSDDIMSDPIRTRPILEKLEPGCHRKIHGPRHELFITLKRSKKTPQTLYAN